MPLPSFASVPKCLVNRENGKLSCFTISGDQLYFWKISADNENDQSLCSMNINNNSIKSVQIKNIARSFRPLEIIVHGSRGLFIMYSSSAAFLIQWDDENEICTPLFSKLLQSNKRLRILNCKWAPLLSHNTESFCSEIFVVLFSDNKCRCFSCDSPQIVLNEVDLSDPEDKLDTDGSGFLSDISFDRAICMDFGKPIATVKCDGRNSKSMCVTNIPLFILKSSGEIYCALFSSLIQSTYKLFGPLCIDASTHKRSLWPYEFICLQTDIPILVIAYKTRECRTIDHCVIFFEDDGKQQRLKGKIYESIDINTVSTDISIVKDPTFCDRYFVYSSIDVISIDLQWSWIFSKQIPNDMFDYALTHGALDVKSANRKIYKSTSEYSDNIITISLSFVSLARQNMVIVTEKCIVLLTLSTDTASERMLFGKNISEVEESEDYFVDYLGLPVKAKICDIEKLLATLKSSSVPLSVGKEYNMEKNLIARLAIHEKITTLLEESKQDHDNRLKDMTIMLEDKILPQLEKISTKQVDIAKRLRKETIIQSNLNDRIIQVATLIDSTGTGITSSEHRIQQWGEKALKQCYQDLYPKVQDMKALIDQK